MVGAAAGGALVGLLIGRNIVRLNEGLATAADSWKPLADKGLELSTKDGRPTLSGEVRGVRCTVEVVNDVVKYAHTRVTAKASEPVTASIGVFANPVGLFAKVRTLIGQDIEIGDEVFDKEFLIHSDPEKAAGSLLSPDMRGLLTALAGSSLEGFRYENGSVSVQLHGVTCDPTVIEAAVEVAVTAARWAL